MATLKMDSDITWAVGEFQRAQFTREDLQRFVQAQPRRIYVSSWLSTESMAFPAAVSYDSWSGLIYRDAAMEEARHVLDQFPVGHAQLIQQRLRDGKISGFTYGRTDPLTGETCACCFYGTLTLAIAGKIDSEVLDQLKLGYSRPHIGILEGYFLSFQEGHTPENNSKAAEFDAFLTDYIQTRLLAAEASCELAPIEDEEVLIYA